jgi:hypothetical protein
MKIMRTMKKQISILAILAAILLAALAASPVGANNGQGEVIAVTGVIPGQGLMVHVIALHWDQFSDTNPGNDFVDQYYNSANQPAGVSVLQLNNSRAAWNDVASSSFVFHDAGTTNRCPSFVKECRGKQKFDGFNDVGWMNIKDPNTLGVTWSGTTTDEADMALNTRFSWATNGTSDYDVQTVLTHEQGHALGLGHSTVLGAVMEAIYAGPRQDLQPDDIAGVSFLYPGGPPPTPANLVSIAVASASASVAVGQTLQFTATGTYDDSSTSDNAGVASINATGVASGVAVGSADISASQDGVGSNSITLTVTAALPPPPAGTEVGVDTISHNFSGGKGRR